MPTRHRTLTALIPLLLGLATVAVVQLAATPAHAQRDPRAEAKEHYSNGKKLFEQGEYDKAIAEFRAADQLAPSGDDAIRYFRSYLQRVPDASNKAAVESSIAKLEAAIAAEDEARKAAAEEEARRIEEEKKAQPPVATVGESKPPAATGDPELDRVAAVDVNQVRDQRQVAPIGGGGGAAAGGTGAVGPPPNGTGAGAPPPPAPTGEPKKSKPIYKKWWFWVVVGVSAYVLISIIAADSNSDQPQPLEGDIRSLMPSPVQGAPTGGATLWRF
jgi:tetratricopeptide (TPR) repeat protein